MPAPISAAILRFRRRLLLAAFVRGAARAGLLLLLLAVAGALLLRFAAPDLALPSAAGWAFAAVAAAALLVGAWTAARLRPDDRFVAQHLERRLGTDGLLLAAVDGAQLDAAWQRQLQRSLARVPTVLPTVRWRALLTRPALAALLLFATDVLPRPEPASAPQAAAVVATDELLQQAEALAATPGVPDEQAAELLEAARALQQRAQQGETDLWREVDGLEERIARERLLAAEAAGDDAAAGGDGARRSAPDAQRLAEALQQLAAGAANDAGERTAADGSPPDESPVVDSPVADSPLDRALRSLPDDLQQQIAASRRPDGSFDADALPQDEAAREQLASALADAARELAADADALADALTDASKQELARQLEQLAEALDGPSTGERSQPMQVPEFAAQLAAELADDIARAAVEMAKNGAFDELPAELPEGMRELLGGVAEDLAGSVDIEALRALLPDELPQMRMLAELMADAAGGAAQRSPSGARGEPGGGGDAATNALSDDARRRLGALAEQLQRAADGAATGQTAAGAGAGAGADGAPGGVETSSPDGGGHTALRLTEQTFGGVGERELELPQRAPVDELADEWKPLRADKAAPEVAELRAAGAGGEAATGAGVPTWQLRLGPRDRALLRRYFAEDKR